MQKAPVLVIVLSALLVLPAVALASLDHARRRDAWQRANVGGA